MKSRIIIVMLLSMFFFNTESFVQNFLRNLGQSIKKEVKKEVQKQVDKGVDKPKEGIKARSITHIVQ